MDFDFRLDHGVAAARCHFVAGITLRSLAPFTWNKSKGETFSLVVKCSCYCAYTNENSDNGNRNATSECAGFFLKRKIIYNLFIVQFFLASHCYRSVGPIY